MPEAESASGNISKEWVPSDLVAALLAKRSRAELAPERRPLTLPARIYGVMTATALLTFATLTQGYEMFFTHQLYA